MCRLHQRAVDAAWLRSPLGRTAFEWAYDLYKRFYEASGTGSLSQYIRPGTTVIDVGANVGFFTQRFGRWVGPSGRVIAIEPEDTNFSRLKCMIERRGLARVVEPVQAVASDAPGTSHLQVSHYHPGDHKIGETGVPIRAVTIDNLMARDGIPPVSLIKIDVQGAEERVLHGARQALMRWHPVLFLEVDDDALRAMGSSSDQLLNWLAALGYQPRCIRHGRVSSLLSAEEIRPLCQQGRYVDLVLLADGVRGERRTP
ncbi:MAG TPA: FkbM family methyltransferase [Verrucomicrobiae bacterium]|nr:FkbM family methyltransferase [Verrucomicrobiae bacterium]